MTYTWERAEKARVAATDLGGLEEHLAQLAPADPQRGCTADRGPRWMLVYAAENDLTGVIVDDYGCHDVRLTDEPFDTPPGDAVQPGTVPGVLTTPDGGTLVDKLKAAAR